MDIIIKAPDDFPKIPEGFHGYQIQTVDENFDVCSSSNPDRDGLKLESYRWSEFGYKALRLIFYIESNQDKPDRQIYSEWDEDKRSWGEWCDYMGEGKFDFEEFYNLPEENHEHSDAQYDLAKDEGEIPW